MPSGTAAGTVSLTGNSSAFPSPTPLSNVLGVDDPFYAVKNLNAVILNTNNPSCRYSFTYRFRIPATASAMAKLRDNVWCPSLVFPGLASGSANLSTFAYGSFYGRAFVTANLTSVSNGGIIVFAQADGDAELTPLSSGQVRVFAAADGSMSLISSTESTTDVPGVADSLGPLVGNALATTRVNAVAEGEANLEGETEASVDVFAIADTIMEFTGDAESQTNVFAIAEGSAELTGDTESQTNVFAIAEGSAELEGELDGNITLLRGEAEGEASLIGEAEGNLGLIPAAANSDVELTSDAEGIILSPPSLDVYNWEEAMDTSSIQILGTGIGVGITNNTAANGADVVNVGDPMFSSTSASAEFSGVTSNGNSSMNWNSLVGASTSGLSSSGIGSSRVNQAISIPNTTSQLARFNVNDNNPSNQRISVFNAPFHYRAIAQINSGENFEFLSLQVLNTFAGPKFGAAISYQNGDLRGNFTSIYDQFGNPLIASSSQATPLTITGSEWVLVDFIIRQNGSFPQYEVIANGTQMLFTPTDTRFSWVGGSVSTYGRCLRNLGATPAKGLFFGYRTGIDFTLAEHNADRADLGL